MQVNKRCSFFTYFVLFPNFYLLFSFSIKKHFFVFNPTFPDDHNVQLLDVGRLLLRHWDDDFLCCSHSAQVQIGFGRLESSTFYRYGMVLDDWPVVYDQFFDRVSISRVL